VIDKKYFKILWGNKSYVDIAGKSIEERNEKTIEYHKKHYTKEDNSTLMNSVQFGDQDT
jgi:hypothetical protein